jgi:hypothetical protein
MFKIKTMTLKKYTQSLLLTLAYNYYECSECICNRINQKSLKQYLNEKLTAMNKPNQTK